MVGLSQEEKKSSSASPVGVSVSETSIKSSVIITSLGYLRRISVALACVVGMAIPLRIKC